MTADSAALTGAFTDLREVVSSMVARNRQPLIQGVKPALQVKSAGSFDERALGFGSFGEFVDAAASAGFVRVTRTEHGRRLGLVSPPGTPGDRVVRPRVRPDLWAAFTDWSGRRSYVWDSSAARVVSVPVDAPASEGVAVTPVDAETHREWARAFLLERPAAPIARPLRLVLDESDAPFEQFSRLIRADSRLDGEWRGYRRTKIVESINEWARGHDISVDPYGPTATPEVAPAAPEARLETDEAEPLRKLARAAVENMSPTELRELRLPLGAIEHLLR